MNIKQQNKKYKFLQNKKKNINLSYFEKVNIKNKQIGLKMNL